MSRFNLLDGVDPTKIFQRVVKPGEIFSVMPRTILKTLIFMVCLGPLPLGYSFQAKKTSEETHQLPIPVGQDAPNNTAEVFNDLMAFLLVFNRFCAIFAAIIAVF